ncbi:class I SAM-dependent methyltransferase [Humisphaera borealis]|uniref:Class I SAM-dependent methyltransferase n=1 Tax=Humisphaera borealis TaxID=2807512 RepID=A0A7M2WUM9_9BACT|nr:class I SAM-dependent methyltransferase [Humisphaera borealis]QOV89228.1 class I SAM-dependent methyltransferase [Humisphaera borealis]
MRPGHEAFSYSEGQKVERKTLDLLGATTDRSQFSQELLRHIASWPTLYHFSPARHNLLRHLTIGREHSVLELGAGCGAITRQLGEAAGDVWAIEGGPIRAACAAARTADLPNVRVFCSDFQAIDTGRKFDIVTLIGVLEYSPVFFKTPDPFLDCLRLAKSFLKPGGVLLLAIENQLGLKYFCGSPEDHTGRPFDGVQDLYKPAGVKTVGKAELSRYLAASGFPAMEFHYPFPDYKLPSWVLTDRALHTPDFDPAAILRLIETTHEGRRLALPADERKVRSVLHRNGLLADLANSFLVIAAEETPRLSPPELLAAGYVTDRQPWFNTRTAMVLGDGGQILVRKSRLIDVQPPAGTKLTNVVGTEAYRTGPQLEHLVVDLLQRGDFDGAIAHLRSWIDHLLKVGVVAIDPTDKYQSLLKPDFFDCTPPNLIINGVGLKQIDTEWHYAGAMPVRTLALRYLKMLASREQAIFRKHLAGKTPAAIQLLNKLGIDFTREQYSQASELLHELNASIVAPHRGRLPDHKKKRRRSLLSRLLRRKKE